MRLWHVELLPYLPDLQFKGQLRELVVILRDWRDKGSTNHLLINKIMDFPKEDLWIYFIKYHGEYSNRYKKPIDQSIYDEFVSFAGEHLKGWHRPFPGWHDRTYLLLYSPCGGR